MHKLDCITFIIFTALLLGFVPILPLLPILVISSFLSTIPAFIYLLAIPITPQLAALSGLTFLKQSFLWGFILGNFFLLVFTSSSSLFSQYLCLGGLFCYLLSWWKLILETDFVKIDFNFKWYNIIHGRIRPGGHSLQNVFDSGV